MRTTWTFVWRHLRIWCNMGTFGLVIYQAVVLISSVKLTCHQAAIHEAQAVLAPWAELDLLVRSEPCKRAGRKACKGGAIKATGTMHGSKRLWSAYICHSAHAPYLPFARCACNVVPSTYPSAAWYTCKIAHAFHLPTNSTSSQPLTWHEAPVPFGSSSMDCTPSGATSTLFLWISTYLRLVGFSQSVRTHPDFQPGTLLYQPQRLLPWPGTCSVTNHTGEAI